MTNVSVASFKVPTAYDNNRPKFDGSTLDSLRLFFKNTELICKNGGITGEQEQKLKLLEYMDSLDMGEQWQKLPAFAVTKTYLEWKKEILDLYPEIEDMMFGSMKKLVEICQAARFISQSDLGKLRRFSLAFTNEAEKLMDGSAAVVNKQLVDLILAVLEKGFASELERAMNQRAIDDLSKVGGNAGNNPPAKPPEDRVSAADREDNWRNRKNKENGEIAEGHGLKWVEFLQPEEPEDEEVPKSPKRRADRRIILDDEDSEEELTNGQFDKLHKPPGFQRTDGSLLKTPKSAIRPQKERAYKLVPKFDDSEIVGDLVKQKKGVTLEGITVEMMAAMSSDYAKRLRDITFKMRRPLRPIPTEMSFIQEMGDPYEDGNRLRLELDAIPLLALPPVDSFFISTEEAIDLAPGCIVATDIVLTYYSMLDVNQLPKQIYSSMELASLRVLLPFVAGMEKVECVLDTGSQIVSMAKTFPTSLFLISTMYL
ncbi:hypothetical protein K438DRAFT_1983355 [Mycena galopus ATCC 62051]|nr:hypothetical protein K438DRAFT_1983355 [Mycena galopus ATCC 62051]